MSSCQPFAIMRLTHEAIRRGLEELETALDATPHSWAATATAFNGVTRCIQLHAAHEDLRFYPPLEEKEPGISAAFTNEHTSEIAEMKRLAQAIENARAADSSKEVLEPEIRAFIDDHRAHLVHEEEVLLEKLPVLFTYMESVGVVRSILDYDTSEFEDFQLPWVYSRLLLPQREMYRAMLKGCSPEGKFSDFQTVISQID